MTGRQDDWAAAPLSDLDKGAPGDGSTHALGEVGAAGLNILAEDIPLPVAIIRDGPLRRNGAWMRAFLDATGAKIAPHGKTTMVPDIFDLQIADGAWGITVATAHQIRVARHFGHRRIFVANQIVGRAAIDYLFRALADDPDLEIYCIVDSLANVGQLAAGARRAASPRPLRLLVELGFPRGRTGCRTIDEALAVAEAVARSPGLELAGVEGFEGIAWGAPPEKRIELVTDFLDRLASLATACSQAGLFAEGPVLLSAGGTAYFDLVAERLGRAELPGGKEILLRSGCYVTHDSVVYEKSLELLMARSPDIAGKLGPMEHALEVWAYVQSCPEPGRVIVALGKRDISYDDMPVPLKWCRPGRDAALSDMPEGHRVVALNDQHGFMDVPADSPLAVGDMIAFGISHPCLTFDKWRVLHLVNDAYDIVRSVRTYF